MSRSALVTGGSGFVGRHLMERLARDGWDVAGYGRRAIPDRTVRWHVGDIADVDRLAAAMQAQRSRVVFHLAAIVDTVETPSVVELYRVNTLGTVAVLEAASRAPSVERVVLASSAFAYGHVDDHPERVSEELPLRPTTPYGASKASAEGILGQWSLHSGIDTVVARGFQVSGPGHTGRYALAEWARNLTSGATELRVGRVDVVRDYTDVRDVAAAFIALADRGVPGRAYNVGSGEERTMASLLESLRVAAGSAAEVVPDPARVRRVDQPIFVADISRIVQDTGWRPTIGVEQMLVDLVATARGEASP